MKFKLPPLPYAKDALEPHMSAETLEFHYEKHHKGYLDKLEAAIKGTPTASLSLEEIIRTSKGPVYNNAAQVWNHTHFWESMQPRGGGRPTGVVGEVLNESFGSYDAFREQFIKIGTELFGTGYVWLVVSEPRVSLIAKPDADSPLSDGLVPVLNCDVWEHAYYLDHRHEREKYLETFLDALVSWPRVEQRLNDAHDADHH